MSDDALAEQTPAATPPPPARNATRRALAWALAIGLAVMLVRSAAVIEVTNETWDEDYHVLHGLLDLTNFRHSTPVPIGYNDPPLGGMLVALPVWLAGGTVLGTPEPDHPTKYEWPNRPSSLWGQQWAPNTLRHLIAAVCDGGSVQPHGADFADGYRCAEVCDAILRAAESGRREAVAYRQAPTAARASAPTAAP